MNPGAAAGGSRLAAARRVVIKVGSALLVEKSTGSVNRDWLEALADDIAAVRARGQEVVLVSSGAIALGRRELGLAKRRPKLEEKQAAAAVGQIRLAHAWKEVLERRGFTVAQVLLTLGDTEERRRYLNARNTLTTLLRLGAIPVINENDTVATAEIRYGDNDRLGARVAQMVSADCLVLLSDVDGLYTADPTRDETAQFIPEVPRITPEIEAMAGGSASDVGSGGMATKVMAQQLTQGSLDAICMGPGPWRTMNEQEPGKYRVIGESVRVPGFALSLDSELSDQEKKKLTAILVGMGKNPEGKRALAAISGSAAGAADTLPTNAKEYFSSNLLMQENKRLYNTQIPAK